MVCVRMIMKTIIMSLALILFYNKQGVHAMDKNLSDVVNEDKISVSIKVKAIREIKKGENQEKIINEKNGEKIEAGLDTVIFSCEIHGPRHLKRGKLTLIKDNEEEIDYKYGKTDFEVKIDNFKRKNNGNYKCLFKTLKENKIFESNEIKCEIDDQYNSVNRPSIEYHGKNFRSYDKKYVLYAAYGQVIQLHCIPFKPEAKIIWYQDHIKLNEPSNYHLILTMEALENGIYSCQESFKNETSMTSNEVHLKVIPTKDLSTSGANGINLRKSSYEFQKGSYKCMLPLNDKEKIILVYLAVGNPYFGKLQKEYETLETLRTRENLLKVPLLNDDESIPKFYSLPKLIWEKLCKTICKLEYQMEKNDRIYFAGMIQKRIEGVHMHFGHDRAFKQSLRWARYQLTDTGFDFHHHFVKKVLKHNLKRLLKYHIEDLQFMISNDGTITIIDAQKIQSGNAGRGILFKFNELFITIYKPNFWMHLGKYFCGIDYVPFKPKDLRGDTDNIKIIKEILPQEKNKDFTQTNKI